jgi:hypothetical protein
MVENTGRNFVYGLGGLDLFLWIKIPCTRLQELSLYRLHTLPVPMLGEQGLTTRVLKSIMGQDSHTVVGEVIEDQNQSLVETGEMA